MSAVTAFEESRSVLQFVWTDPANRGRRLRMVARATLFEVEARVLHRPGQAQIGYNAKLWVDLHRTSATKALYANPPDWKEMSV